MRMYRFAFGWALACALTSAYAAEVTPGSGYESTSHAYLQVYSLQTLFRSSEAPIASGDSAFGYWVTTGAIGNWGIFGYNGALMQNMPENGGAASTAVAEIVHNNSGHFTLMLNPQLRLTLDTGTPIRLNPMSQDSVIPEPASLTLMAAGVLLLAARWRATR